MVLALENIFEIEYELATEENLYIGSGGSTFEEPGWENISIETSGKEKAGSRGAKLYTRKGDEISANAFYAIPDGASRKILLPGSSLKGVVRACAEDLIGKVDGLFGSKEQASRILFEDLEVNGGLVAVAQASINRMKKAVPRNYICIAPGQKVRGKLQVRNCSVSDLKLILSCFMEISSGKYPLGGGKSRGMGSVRIKENRITAYSPTGNISWIKTAKWAQDGLLKKAVFAGKLPSYFTSRRLVFDATLTVTRPVHVGNGRNELVMFNGEYVIPGSSLKGAYRIANPMHEGLFGDTEQSSEIIFSDFYPEGAVVLAKPGRGTDVYNAGTRFKGSIILKSPENERALLDIFSRETSIGRAVEPKKKGAVKIELRKQEAP